MSVKTSLVRTGLFAGLYLAATVAGRMTTMEGTNLSMVWPAAGVAVVWFTVQRSVRWRGVDVAALSVVTVAVNMATGVPASLAAFFLAANLVQLFVFMGVFARWCPHLWGAGGDEQLARVADLWRLIGAAAIAATCGAAIGPTGAWLLGGEYLWLPTAVWLIRNVVSVVHIGAVGLRVGYAVAARRDRARRPGDEHSHRSATAGSRFWRMFEYGALLTCSSLGYLVAFVAADGLPLAFPLLLFTVWASLRLNTTFVVLHDLLIGTAAIVFTLHGDGPFAAIESPGAQALVAQAFVGMVAVVGLALALGRDERVTLVDRLAAAERDASAQARLMATIVDTMSDGVAVVDRDGRLLLRNPAASRLLGGVASGTGHIASSGYYGLFHPDGTPLADEDMAYARALHGQDTHNMDVLVRNPGVPGGRILSVSATALPADGDRPVAAVVVYHDVTAERRQRDELASFAGVVAHDLINPLCIIESWSDALAETLYQAPDHPAASEASDCVARIQRAAARMRALIDDLLSYTTARDGALTAVPVPVRDVVTDIAATRIDLAVGAGTPVPQFDIGDLHLVHADPVLLRQLLDNLISNSIKYTAEGITPRITITSSANDGETTFCISDNGIGIPAGQHQAIFDNFHRAHPTADYSGTGLGLAICKRIVERHGGSITATDNPGGGSCFTFTIRTSAPGLTVHAGSTGEQVKQSGRLKHSRDVHTGVVNGEATAARRSGAVDRDQR